MHTNRSVCFVMSDTREYIIDQAYSLFLSRSYEAVSISDISKAIGFTKGALYHHFTNKEELFKAVINKYLPFEKFFVPAKDITLQQYIEESIKLSNEIVLSIFGENPKFIPLSYMALLIDAFRHYPEFAKEKDRLLNSELDKIKIVLNNAIMNGEIRKNINADVMAMNFFSLNAGIATSMIQYNSPKKAIETLREQLYELYKIMKV